MDFLTTMTDCAADELMQKASALPIQLTVMDVANFLGISRTSAYKLTHSEGFPAIQLKGFRRLIIPKKLFLDWFVGYLKEFGVAANLDIQKAVGETQHEEARQ